MLTISPPIDHARLKEHVAKMEGGLEARIHEGGKYLDTSNLSHSFGSYCHLHHTFGSLHAWVRVHSSTGILPKSNKPSLDLCFF